MMEKRITIRVFRIVAAFITVCAVGLYFALSVETARAGDIVITGDAAGSLRITSDDKSLFDLTGLYPGDAAYSSVTVRNIDMTNQGFELSMYVENTTGAEYDLGRVTRLRADGNGRELYNGMLIDFDQELNSASPINLGRIGRGESMPLTFAIELDGALADNNYQEQRASFVVTFVADSYGPPDEPTSTRRPTRPSGGTETESTPPAVEITSITPLALTEAEDSIPIEDAITPLGGIEPEGADTTEPEADTPDEIQIEGDETPLGAADDREMPKTGEISLLFYIFAGIVLICWGSLFLTRKPDNGETQQGGSDDEEA